MKNTFNYFVVIYFSFLSVCINAQELISPDDLEKYAVRFSIDKNYEFDEPVKQLLSQEVSENNFVGLAELHQSEQLSFFTTALLKVLAENGFDHFALELGPFSAQVIENIVSIPEETEKNIRKFNNTYGNRLYGMTPLIFVDRKEDAIFVEQASALDFKFWGLDQEFIYSYEMHLDIIYSYADNPNKELRDHYEKLKSRMSKWAKKAARSKFKYNCQLIEDPITERFFDHFKEDPKAMEHIQALQTSWDIYCKSESGKGSNQQRANYMKQNFVDYYKEASKKGETPKVFVKLGNVHLTKGTSPFGVEDVGKFLSESAETLNTGFLNFRQLPRFRNGKDLKDKKLWASVKLFMELGRKDQWTLIDLRPLRKQLKEGTLTANKKVAYEINSYDFILIPPNDKKAKQNF